MALQALPFPIASMNDNLLFSNVLVLSKYDWQMYKKDNLSNMIDKYVNRVKNALM